MRTALTVQLKTVTALGSRVYEFQTSPTGVVKPYAVLKFVSDLKDVQNKYGSIVDIQVFIYEAIGKLSSLDDIEIAVRKALHNIDLYTNESPTRHFNCIFQQTIGDLKDDTNGLIFKRLDFIIVGARA